MTEPTYDVLWPLGKLAYEPVPTAPRVADLKGKTICELSNYMFRAEEILPIIRQAWREKYPGIKFVDYNEIGNIHGWDEAEALENLPETLRKHGCDTAVSGVGA